MFIPLLNNIKQKTKHPRTNIILRQRARIFLLLLVYDIFFCLFLLNKNFSINSHTKKSLVICLTDFKQDKRYSISVCLFMAILWYSLFPIFIYRSLAFLSSHSCHMIFEMQYESVGVLPTPSRSFILQDDAL